jgi:hypothetical protein
LGRKAGKSIPLSVFTGSTRLRHYDVLNLRADILRLIPVRAAMLIRDAVDDHAAASRRQRCHRRTHNDCGRYADGYANSERIDVPAVIVVVVVVVVIVVMMVIIAMVVVVVMTIVVMIAATAASAAVVVIAATAAAVMVVVAAAATATTVMVPAAAAAAAAVVIATTTTTTVRRLSAPTVRRLSTAALGRAAQIPGVLHTAATMEPSSLAAMDAGSRCSANAKCECGRGSCRECNRQRDSRESRQMLHCALPLSLFDVIAGRSSI